MPAASVARTVKLWLPSVRLLSWSGDVQLLYALPSTEHSNVELCSEEVKEKLGLGLFDGSDGCPVIVVSGATVSTVQVEVAGDWSTFPKVSVARTLKVWLPSARPPYVLGEAQLEKAAVSSLHSKVELGLEEVKEKLALALPEGFGGCDVIVVSGPLASIDHV